MLKNKMKLKTRKRFRIKLIFYLLLMYVTFAYTFYYGVNNNSEIANKKFISYLLNGGNIDNLTDIKLNKIVNKTINYIFNIDLTNPTTILNNASFKKNQNLINLQHNDDYSNMEKLKEISSYIEDPYPIDTENPLIYLYNSHQLENYNSQNLEVYGITPNVLMASYIFKERLNKTGISTIVEDTNFTEFLNVNNWDYSSSYKASRIMLLDSINKYSSLKYFIDIHRDSVTKEATTVTIDNKSYARVLFVIGLEHDSYQKNLTFTEEINNLINQKYPKLSKGILKKEGVGVDGIYNQDVSEHCILIEVGGVENNINEVFNTLDALTEVFNLYLKENK